MQYITPYNILGVGLPMVLGGILAGVAVYFLQSGIVAQAQTKQWLIPLITGLVSAVIFAILGYFYLTPYLRANFAMGGTTAAY